MVRCDGVVVEAVELSAAGFGVVLGASVSGITALLTISAERLGSVVTLSCSGLLRMVWDAASDWVTSSSSSSNDGIDAWYLIGNIFSIRQVLLHDYRTHAIR